MAGLPNIWLGLPDIWPGMTDIWQRFPDNWLGLPDIWPELSDICLRLPDIGQANLVFGLDCLISGRDIPILAGGA